MEIIENIKAANLPDEQYCVIGSGPLVALGIIPENNDIDLAVSPELFTDLQGRGWEAVVEPHNTVLKHGVFDAGVGFGEWSLEKLLEDAFYVEDVAFASLQKVLAWKRAANRPKDAGHIRRIEAYLARQGGDPTGVAIE